MRGEIFASQVFLVFSSWGKFPAPLNGANEPMAGQHGVEAGNSAIFCRALAVCWCAYSTIACRSLCLIHVFCQGFLCVFYQIALLSYVTF